MASKVIRRRVKRLILLTLILVIGVGTVYGYRRHQKHERDTFARGAALDAAKRGEHQRVIELLESYLPYHPDDVDAYAAYIKSRPLVPAPQGAHLASTMVALRHVLRSHPDRVDERRQLLDLYLQTGYFAEALDTATVLMNVHGSADPQTLRARAVSLARMRRMDEATHATDAWVKASPNDIEARAMSLWLMSMTRRTDFDITFAADKAYVAASDAPRADLLKGYARLLVKDPGERAKAVGYLEAAAKAMPENDPAYADALVKALDQAGMTNVSLGVVRRLYERQAEKGLRYDLIRRLWEAGQVAEVATLAAGTSEDVETPTNVLAMGAISLYSIERNADAAKLAGTLKSRVGDAAAAAWSLIIDQRSAATDASPAMIISACQHAITQNPNESYLRMFLGLTYARIGEGDLAVRIWQEASTQNQSWAAPLVSMSRVQLEMGRYESAYKAATEAVRRGRENPNAQAALMRAWGKCIEQGVLAGTEADLLQKLGSADAVAGAQAEVVGLRATALVKSGKIDEAKALLQKLLTSKEPLTRASLLQCAAFSREHRLGLEDGFYDRCRRDHGESAELAFVVAFAKGAAGVKGFEAAMAAAGGSKAGRDWRIHQARLLDLNGDARAKQLFIALADEMPGDSVVQTLALSAKATRTDFEFRQRAIERLLSVAGEPSLSWRVERARLLLDQQPTGTPPGEAMTLLRDAVTRAPDWTDARVLFGSALQRAGKSDEAIAQLRMARTNGRPSATLGLQLAALHQERGEADQARIEVTKVSQALLDAAPDAQFVALAADLLAQQGDAAKAEEALAKLDELKLAPGVRELTRAEHFARHDKLEQAIEIIESAAAATPTNATLWRALARYELASGRPGEAAAALAKGLRSVPDDSALQAIGQKSNLLGAAIDPSLRAMTVAFVTDPVANAAAAQALEVAWEQAQAGLPQSRVREQLAKLAEQNPNMLALWSLLAQKYLDVENFEAAMAAAQRTVALAPDLAGTHRLVAEVAGRARKWDVCLDAASKWRALSLAHPFDADLAVAKSMSALGRSADARTQLRPYLNNPAQYPAASMVLAQTPEIAAKQHAELLDAMLAAGPAGRMAFMSYAVANLSPSDATQSLNRVAKTIAATATDERLALAEAWGSLATVSGDAKFAREARAIITPLAAKSDASATTLLAMARRLDQDGDAAEAEAMYRRVIALGPSTVAQNNLAMLLAQAGRNLDEARSLLEDAIGRAPALAPLYDTQAFVLSKSGDQSGALRSIYKAIQLQSNNAEYRIHLAELLMRTGEQAKVAEALADLEKMPLSVEALARPVRQRLDTLRIALAGRTANAGGK